MCSKIKNFKNFISVFDKNSIFYPKWDFFIRVDISISIPTLSSVLHNSGQNSEKFDILFKGILLMWHDLQILI